MARTPNSNDPGRRRAALLKAARRLESIAASARKVADELAAAGDARSARAVKAAALLIDKVAGLLRDPGT